MLQQPQQHWPRRTKFLTLPEHSEYGLLHALVRVLLQTPVQRLEIANRHRRQEFPAPRLLVSPLDSALPQQVQLVFVETPLESEQQPVVA